MSTEVPSSCNDAGSCTCQTHAPPSGFRLQGYRRWRVPRAVRDLHQRERSMLPAGLEPIEPLVPLPDRPLYVDVTKRTLAGLAIVTGTLSGVCQAPRPKGAAGQGEGDLLLAVNVSGPSVAQQSDTELSLQDGDALLWTQSLAGIGIMRLTPVRFLGCRVPRSEVAALLGRLDDTPMRLVPRDTERCSCSSPTPEALRNPCRLRRPSCNGSRSAT